MDFEPPSPVPPPDPELLTTWSSTVTPPNRARLRERAPVPMPVDCFFSNRELDAQQCPEGMNRHTRRMFPDRPTRPASAALILALVALAGLILGITAQLLRQVTGPLMALGAATAPWLTIGFLLAVWATRWSTSPRRASVFGIGTMVVYLVVWLLSYHLTFAIRESVAMAAAWRETAPFLVLAGPTSMIAGLAAAAAHKRDFAGDLCLALPIAWSTPEVVTYPTEGWTYAVFVAIPTALVALLPLMAVSLLRDVRPLRVLLACCSFALAGLALLPLLRNLIHS